MFVVEAHPANTVLVDLAGINILSAEDARELVKRINAALGNEAEAGRLRKALEAIAHGADCERRYPDNPSGPAWESIYQMAQAALQGTGSDTEGDSLADKQLTGWYCVLGWPKSACPGPEECDAFCRMDWVTCPDCGGERWHLVGTHAYDCETCGGRGEVPDNPGDDERGRSSEMAATARE